MICHVVEYNSGYKNNLILPMAGFFPSSFVPKLYYNCSTFETGPTCYAVPCFQFQEAFGFIERADVVKEIFFHYSEFKGDLEALQAGDDVEFTIKDRNVSATF